MESTNTRIRLGRIVYFILASVFALFTIAQFLFAGMAIFNHPVNWMKHTMFAHLFGFNLPVFMLIFAFVGAMPRWAYWQLFGILGSIFLMYFTANIRGEIPWLSSLHPVVGLLLFLLSCSMVLKSWKFIFNQKDSEREELK